MANLPAEMAHLFEEIQAKDKGMQDCRNTIAERDNSLQKFIRLNGSLAVNPKEEAYGKIIMANYDQAQSIQDEKQTLTDKAGLLLDRQIRRLDIKIRDLTRQGVMPKDPSLPCILYPNGTSDGGSGSVLSGISTPNNNTTGNPTPLNPISNNNNSVLGGLPGTTIANSSISRLAHPQPQGNLNSHRTGSQLSLTGQGHRSSLNNAASNLTNSAPATPAASMAHLHQRQRESSAGALGVNEGNKRRRLNAHLGSIPSTSSALARQSSLGPSGIIQSKAGTPSSARSGSLGPKKSGGAGGTKGQSISGGRSSSQARRKGGRAGQQQQQQQKRLTKKQQQYGGGAGALSIDNDRKTDGSIGINGGSTTAGSGGSARQRTPVDHANMPKVEEEEEQDKGSEMTTIKMKKRDLRKDGIKQKSGEDMDVDDDGEVEDDEANVNDDEDDEEEDGDDDDEASDDRKYCTCRNISYGNMVACDNDDCPYEWFHWSCVGMTKEPIGKWYCPECGPKMADDADDAEADEDGGDGDGDGDGDDWVGKGDEGAREGRRKDGTTGSSAGAGAGAGAGAAAGVGTGGGGG